MLKFYLNPIIIIYGNTDGKVSIMRKYVSRMIAIIGCVCIIIAGCLFAYNKFLTHQNYKNAKKLYSETTKLIPPVYMSSVKGDVAVEGYLMRGTITSTHLHCVISRDHDLPYYKNKMVVIPDYLKPDLQKISIGEVITLKRVNGRKVSYKVTDSGRIPYKNLTSVGLTLYSKTNGYCYFVSSKKL